MSLSPNFAELLWKLEVIYVSYWVGHQIVRKLHTFPQNHLARSHEHTNCSKGLCNWIMLINPLLPDQMNIFGNEFCIFPQSIFVVLNSVSFHLISKGHPYQGLECWVEAYDFFNVFFFIILWTGHQSPLLLCFVRELKMILTFLTSFAWRHLDAKLVFSYSHNFTSSLA